MRITRLPRWVFQAATAAVLVLGTQVLSSALSPQQQRRVVCQAGYAAKNGACADIDECATDNGGCGTEKCANTPGGWTCGINCPAGFTGTPATGCVDINECAVENGGCDAKTLC